MIGVMVMVRSTRRGEGWECTVDVDDPRGTTHHAVDVTDRDRERWGRPNEPVEQLVQRAFEFLLAREAPAQILRRFDLSDIERYFPDFDEDIRRP